MRNNDLFLHVRGESQYVDDLNLPDGCLHAAVFYSTIAHGEISELDVSEALAFPGVQQIVTAADIPGENQIGNIIRDESLLCSGEVHFMGQPIAVILAENGKQARAARDLVHIKYKQSPAVTDPRVAFANDDLIAPPRTFSIGDCENAWAECDTIVEGTVNSGGQEHLYLETQAALTVPLEGGRFKIYSSTQSPTAVQRTVAGILDVPMHRIEVDVLRLGGAFGGKEDQATAWAALSALSSKVSGKAVKLTLRRPDDLKLTGKRHPYSSDFKIGLSKTGKILAYQVMFYQNAGAAADLSTAILERTLFHSTGSYFIPNVKATAASCRTNLPPNTAFRGFGGPQAMFVMEAAISKAADNMGFSVAQIQNANLIQKGNTFPYGMQVKDNHARDCWERANTQFRFDERKKAVREFNRGSEFIKKGISLMPVCFGISFTSTFLNQAAALVHVYSDGSVSVSTGAIEMGQGVNEKIRLVASRVFSISPDRIHLESTNTSRVANTSPTAASSGADMNGNATRIACEMIKQRLLKQARIILQATDEQPVQLRDEAVFQNGKKVLNWEELVQKTYFSRTSLSAQAHYATPNIFFDKSTEKGNAFAYHVVGTAITEVSVDCLRGTYNIERVDVVHDFGESLDKKVDLGQMEGGLVQGIGWMTMEDLRYDENGRLLSNSLSTYKVPDIYSMPREMNIEFYENPENSAGPFNSKAIGEPPLMYGIGSYFAILQAMKAYRPEMVCDYNAPMTPENLLMQLYSNEKTWNKENYEFLQTTNIE